MLWVRRLFPGHFANHVFMRVGEIDAHSYDGAEAVKVLRAQVERSLAYFVGYSIGDGVPATSYTSYGIDVIGELHPIGGARARRFPQLRLLLEQADLSARYLVHPSPAQPDRHRRAASSPFSWHADDGIADAGQLIEQAAREAGDRRRAGEVCDRRKFGRRDHRRAAGGQRAATAETRSRRLVPRLTFRPVPPGLTDGEQDAGLYKSRFGKIALKAEVTERGAAATTSSRSTASRRRH